MPELKERIRLYCSECGCEVEAVKGKLRTCCGTKMKGKKAANKGCEC